MKHVLRFLLFTLFIFANTSVFAQEVYTISGIVTDENHTPIKGATVFIGGSQKITSTDADGKFIFDRIEAGNYQISTKMLGYTAPSQAVIIHKKSLTITIILQSKSIGLREVVIGTNTNRDYYYSIFKDQFLGRSKDAKKCTILNPDAIYFSSKKIGDDNMVLKAEADELLIIENKQLGYRIKYLLRAFEHNSKTLITFYDGDPNFEEMDGTETQKKIWVQNRLEAYQGSLMHFFRSVFSNNLLEEGFITNQMVKSRNSFDRRTYMMPEPVKLDTLVTKMDSSFVSFKFTALNIVYNPKEVLRLKEKELKIKSNNKPTDKPTGQDALLTVTTVKKSSQLFLYLKEAILDASGSVSTGYKTFLIRGNWADKRIGDQLPFEYQPPRLTLTIN